MLHQTEPALFAALLRQHRLDAGLTQEALAERAGVSPRAIQALERGDHRPQRDTARRLAAALALAGAALDAFVAAAGPAPRGRATSPATGYPPAAAAAAAPAATTAGAPAGERRHLTVLFCDLVDSTTLAGRLDPEDLVEVLQAYHEVCARVIARCGGHVARIVGDGLLAYFGYPHAHEDDAQRAVRAGLGVVEALGELGTRLERERGLPVPLAARVAVHSGLVVVGEQRSGEQQDPAAVAGLAPHLASRLQEMAPPNGVVISGATYRLVRGYFACQALGEQRLRGVDRPVAVYRALAESGARSRLEAAASIGAGLTSLVGREAELALLRERWQQVREGMGQVVLLTGEAGIGKSRLVRALMEQLAGEPDAWLTPLQCSPHHQHTPLYPVVDLLERVVLQFEPGEPPEQRLRALEGFLLEHGLPLDETVPLFAPLWSLPLGERYAPPGDSPDRRRQLHQALLAVLAARAARQPLLLVVEDLHWADPSTLELLGSLVEQGPAAPLLALMTCRPEMTPPWAGRAHVTRLTAGRLASSLAGELVDRVAGGRPLPPEVRAAIVERADGVPLFIEELATTVLESGTPAADGRDRPPGSPPAQLPAAAPPLPVIPETLYDSLLARLDRLGPAKEVAQLAATIGREFTHDLLAAVAPWDERALAAALARLAGAELVYQRGLPPRATYVFKHALVQEAAYDSLLRSRRQQFHRRIAEALAARFPDVAARRPELLAHHYTAAGLAEQSIPYWQRAGEQAIERWANLEAEAHLGRGLALLSALPAPDGSAVAQARVRQELALQLRLGEALRVTRGLASREAHEVYARARALCEALGDDASLVPVLIGLGQFHMLRAELRTARELAGQCQQLAGQHDPGLLPAAHRLMGVILCWQGETRAASEHFERIVTLTDAAQRQAFVRVYGQDPVTSARAYLGILLWLRGFPDRALASSRDALAEAERLRHPFSLGHALIMGATLRLMRREAPEAQALADRAVALCTEHEFVDWRLSALQQSGCALALRGRVDEGIARLREGVDAWRATGSELARPTHLTMLAEAYRVAGRLEAALEACDEALATVAATGEGWWEADMHRLKGDLLLAAAPGDAGAAETCYLRAVEVARRQEARSWELRAATSLARLWRRQGRRDEAREALAGIYGWCAEGFDTADLRQARALLAELGAPSTPATADR